jgi:hypothetical protein
MMHVMIERMSDKDLICMVDNLNDRLQEIYTEQTKVQKELTFLLDVMMKRGLEEAKKVV